MPVITGLRSTQRKGQTRQPNGQITRLGSPQTTIDGWSSTIPRSGTFNNPSLRRSALVERVLAPEVSASQVWMAGGSVAAMESRDTCYFMSEERRNLWRCCRRMKTTQRLNQTKATIKRMNNAPKWIIGKLSHLLRSLTKYLARSSKTIASSGLRMMYIPQTFLTSC